MNMQRRMTDWDMADESANIARLGAEMVAVKEGVAELKSMMGKVVAISETVARMQAEQDKHSDGLARAFKELDGLDERVDAVEQRNDEAHDAIKADAAALKTEVQAALNQFRGGVKVAGAVWGVCGVLVIGLVVWAAGEFIDLRDGLVETKAILREQIDKTK